MQVIAESMSPEEIQGLKEMFKAMDTDNSGSITFEELRDGLRKQGSKLAESEVRALMQAVSARGSHLLLGGHFPTGSHSADTTEMCNRDF